MAHYKEYNQAQGQFISIDFDSQIKKGTFEYALNYIIDNIIDLSCFEAEIKNDETGAPAFDPQVMLKIVFFAYSLGIIHSRKIARECHTNVIMMALSGNTRPHFTTIADFISCMGYKATRLFRDVLLICDQMRLISKNMFAMDGCRISSNAAKEWSGKKQDFRRRKKKMEKEVRRLFKRHKELDENEEEQKVQREKESQAIESYKKKIRKIADFIETHEERIGARGKEVQSNITDNESAKMISSHGVLQGYNGLAAVDEKHQVILEAQAIGQSSESDSIASMVEGIKKNLDQEISRDTKVTADTGYFSKENLGYLSREGIDAYIPDTQFRKREPSLEGRERYNRPTDRMKTTRGRKYFGPDDFALECETGRLICPAKEWLYRSGQPVRINGHIFQTYAGRDSKCPNCHLRSQCMRGLKKNVRQVYINLGKNITVKEKSICQKMKEKIDTVKGRFLYSRRMGIVEPVFAHIRDKMKLNYFTLRGRQKVDAQWKLFATLHNMKKLFKYSPLIA